MKIIDGTKIQESIQRDLRNQIAALSVVPTLVIIQVGNNPASNTYIQNKKEFGSFIGAHVIHKKYPNDVSESQIIEDIKKMNNDPSINGIIVQLPIPKKFNKLNVLETVSSQKDADGLHSKSRALGFWPATTRGILTIFESLNVDIKSKDILVIGSSDLVGIPTALALIKKAATVTVANNKTKNIKDLCLNSEIIISAVGKPGLIGEEMVREDQIIIDVGTTKVGDELKGDVVFENVKDKVKAITPVPGGVGPLTVASLFQNLIDLIKGASHK